MISLSMNLNLCTRIMPLVVLAIVAVAEAQPGGPGRRGGGRSTAPSQPRSVELEALVRPSYIGSDLEIIRQQVLLDEGQAIIVETLLADFELAFNEGVQLLRVELQQARPGNAPGSTLEGMQEGQSAYEEQLRVLRESFSAQLREADTFEERERLRDEFTAAMEQLTSERTAIESITGEEDDWGQFLTSQAALLQAWLVERRILEEEFETGVELMLDEAQLEPWVSARRAIRRRDIPAVGVFGGEGIDLVARVRAMNLAPEAYEMLKPLLRQYAVSIDEVVLARNAFLVEAVPVRSTTLAEGNWARMQSIIRDEAVVRTRLRDVNVQWFEHVVAALPLEYQAPFLDELRKDAFGSTWSTSRVDRMVEAAMQMEESTDAERQQLRSIIERCENESLLKRIEEARGAEAPLAWIQQQELRWSRSFDGVEVAARPKSDAMREVEKLQQEAESQCMQEIKGIVGEERYARLPGARTSPRRGNEGNRRSQESDKRRQELYDRFDANGDGRLDSEERKVMRDAMQNERGRP